MCCGVGWLDYLEEVKNLSQDSYTYQNNKIWIKCLIKSSKLYKFQARWRGWDYFIYSFSKASNIGKTYPLAKIDDVAEKSELKEK